MRRIINISILTLTFLTFIIADCHTYYADIDGDGDGAKSVWCSWTDLPHGTGENWEDSNWETNGCGSVGWNGSTSSGHLTYGPYISSTPGTTNVTWNMLVNGDTNNDGTHVVSIDIVDTTTGETIAWQNINVNDFDASMTWQDFTLSYWSSADHVYEFRTWYAGQGGHLVLRYITHINEDADTAGAYATTELCDGDDTSGWSLNDDDLFPTCAVDNYSNVDWAGDQNNDGFYGFDGDNLYINVESYPNIGTATLTVNGADYAMDYADWGDNAHWSYQLPTTASTSYDWSVAVATCGGTSQTVSGTFSADCNNAFNGTAVEDDCGVCGGDGPEDGFNCAGDCIEFWSCCELGDLEACCEAGDIDVCCELGDEAACCAAGDLEVCCYALGDLDACCNMGDLDACCNMGDHTACCELGNLDACCSLGDEAACCELGDEDVCCELGDLDACCNSGDQDACCEIGALEIDCNGECGGDAEVDECGVCGGDGSSCQPTVTVLSPNGGEVWEMGGTYTIEWSGGFSNTGVMLYKNGIDLFDIHGDVGSANSFTWTIQTDLEPGDDYQIYVHDAGPLEEYDLSDDYFTISNPCTPNGDANGDGNINVTDIVITIEFILNDCSTTSEWTECNNLICSSDVNSDGVLNVSDIVVIVANIIGN